MCYNGGMLKNEFTIGIYNLLASSSLARAVVYTIGHIVIAMCINMLITVAPIELAALDALIEPLVNGVWFYIIDKIFVAPKVEANTS